MTAESKKIYDVLPDGTRGEPIDWDDPVAFAALARKRMAPEDFKELGRILLADLSA